MRKKSRQFQHDTETKGSNTGLGSLGKELIQHYDFKSDMRLSKKLQETVDKSKGMTAKNAEQPRNTIIYTGKIPR